MTKVRAYRPMPALVKSTTSTTLSLTAPDIAHRVFHAES